MLTRSQRKLSKPRSVATVTVTMAARRGASKKSTKKSSKKKTAKKVVYPKAPTMRLVADDDGAIIEYSDDDVAAVVFEGDDSGDDDDRDDSDDDDDDDDCAVIEYSDDDVAAVIVEGDDDGDLDAEYDKFDTEYDIDDDPNDDIDAEYEKFDAEYDDAADDDDDDVVDAADDGGNTTALVLFFAVAVGLVVTMFLSFPAMPAEDYAELTFPRSPEQLRTVHALLVRYQEHNYWAVYTGFCVVYIFLQLFAIPGAIFLSILAGPLFGVWTGLATVSLVATTGASACYLLSWHLGRGLVKRAFPSLLSRFRGKIASHRRNLLFYMLFLRVSPLLPNWFISISSPILDVPLRTFFTATLIGLIPANYIHVTTGIALEKVSVINFKTFALLFALAFLALVPTLFRSKFEDFEARMADNNDGGSGSVDANDGKKKQVARKAAQRRRSAHVKRA
jgi:uncharacterized membrane protein YdjX (TVP38/TMEM64 family)